MSGCPTGQEVGVAWLGLLCEQDARDQGRSGIVSGTAVSTFSPVEWQVVTHETGALPLPDALSLPFDFGLTPARPLRSATQATTLAPFTTVPRRHA